MKQIGDTYESIAVSYLQQRKITILERNHRTTLGEIDIIAIDKEKTTLFIEVKGRKTISHGNPAEFVDSRKQTKIIRAAEYYLQQNNLYDTSCRFDVISIIGDLEHSKPQKKNKMFPLFKQRNIANDLTIEWLQNAFENY